MILYVGLVALLSLQGIKLRLRSFNEDYISKDSTDAVRGIFILLIFASHFAKYVDPFTALIDTLYWRLRVFWGQGVVTCFLFFSGYGIALSAREKGDNYVRSMPRKRILPTLLVYDCSQIIFLLVQLCRGKSYAAKDFLLSFAAWESFGNDNWYIFVILGLYIITWLVLRKQELNPVTVARVSVCALAFLLFLQCAGQETYWYNTLLCYPMGMWFFLYRDKIDGLLSKASCYWPVAIVTGTAFLLVHKGWNQSLLLYILTMLLFALCVVILTMKIRLKSPILIYCGRHLQGLFLLHRLPFILLNNYFPHSGPGIYAYFAISIVLTFQFEALFSQAITFLKGNTPARE